MVSVTGILEVHVKTVFKGEVVLMTDFQLDKSELKVPEKPRIAPEQLKTPKEGK